MTRRIVPTPSATAKPATQVQSTPIGTYNPAARRRALPQPALVQQGSAQGLEHTGDRQTQKLQQYIVQATAQIKSLPFAQGNLIQNVSLVYSIFSANPIPHGLPQAWRGVLLCTIRTAGITWACGNLAGYPASKYVCVSVSANCTADIWVW